MSDDNRKKPDASSAGDASAGDASSGNAPSGDAQQERAAPAGARPAAGGDGPQRKWWQKQRWVVPLAVVVLGLVAFGVVWALRSQPETASPGAGTGDAPGEPSVAASGAPGGPAPAAAATPDGGSNGDGAQRQDPRTAQACDRIIAFQRDVEDGGVDLLEAANELSEIERLTRGTALADQANALGADVEDLMLGETDVESVLDSARDLATAC